MLYRNSAPLDMRMGYRISELKTNLTLGYATGLKAKLRSKAGRETAQTRMRLRERRIGPL